MPIRIIPILIGAIAALLLGGCRAPMWVGGDPYEPQITREAAEQMADALALGDVKRRDFLDLHGVYFDEHSRAAARLREYMATVADLEKEPEERHLGEKRITAFTRYAAHVNDLSDHFLSDARLILDPAEDARWPAAERALRRCQFLSGDGGRGGVDLARVVDALNLAPDIRRSLDPTLDDYFIAIDPPLVRQAVFIRTNLKRNLDASDTQDDKVHDDLYREWVGLQRDERSVNRRFAKAIADLLPEERRPEFRDRVQRGMHQLFSRVTEVDEAAKHLPDLGPLDSTVKEQVAEVFQHRDRRRRELTDRIASRLDQWEERTTLDEQLAGTGAPAELATVDEKLDEIDREAVRRLSTLLSAEQMKKIGLRSIPSELPDLEFESDSAPR